MAPLGCSGQVGPPKVGPQACTGQVGRGQLHGEEYVSSLLSQSPGLGGYLYIVVKRTLRKLLTHPATLAVSKCLDDDDNFVQRLHTFSITFFTLLIWVGRRGSTLRMPLPPAGGTRGVPAGYTAGLTSFFLPVHQCFILPVFCISFSLSFTFASVSARVILNNRYPARGVPAGYTAGLGAPSVNLISYFSVKGIF